MFHSQYLKKCLTHNVSKIVSLKMLLKKCLTQKCLKNVSLKISKKCPTNNVSSGMALLILSSYFNQLLSQVNFGLK